MISKTIRVEPSPYEEMLIDHLLESGNGQRALLETIQQLSEEQSALRLRLAQHPLSDHAAAQRLQHVTYALKALWAEVRRVRAVRRVQMEEALGVDPTLVVSGAENEGGTRYWL
jgi:hypothetical protein